MDCFISWQIRDRAFILRYSQIIDILVIFTRQTIRLFFTAIFSVITFGKRSPFLEFMSTSLCAKRIWLCAFACVKRRYKMERAGRVWKFYSRCLYCTTSGTILFLYLRKHPTCAAPFFTRKTPLRRNSARWITSHSLKSANVANSASEL